MKHHITTDHIVSILKQKIDELQVKPDLILGIGRGGLVPAVFAAYHLNIPLTNMSIKSYDKHKQTYHAEILQHPVVDHHIHNNILVIDDVNDTGFTFEYVKHYLCHMLGMPENNLKFLSVIGKRHSMFKSEVCEYVDNDKWVVFPWDV